jgi:arsenate reductase
LKLYSYPRCQTCRKALAWLRAHGFDCVPIDITVHPPTLPELAQALAQLGRKRLFNTSGQSYRALGSVAVQDMDDEQVLAALARDGKLIRRPFLISEAGQVLTGFRQQEWEELLLA